MTYTEKDIKPGMMLGFLNTPDSFRPGLGDSGLYREVYLIKSNVYYPNKYGSWGQCDGLIIKPYGKGYDGTLEVSYLLRKMNEGLIVIF